MESLISVIVPVFNTESNLDECIKSITNQTYKKLEIILVNDGSSDNSLDICYKHASRDERIKVIDKENGGVSTARNHGLNASNGDFVGFVDSDDTIKPSMYEKLLYSITDSDASILITNSIKKSNLQNNDTVFITAEEGLKRILELKLPASQCAYLYRKSTLDNLRNEEDIHFFEDFFFNVEFILRSHKLSICKEDLYNYRMNFESINHQEINKKKLSCLKIYNRLTPILDFQNNLKVKNSAQYFRSHFLISMILSLSKSDFSDEQLLEIYITRLQRESIDMLKDVHISNKVPIVYKIMITMMSKFPRKTLKCIRNLKYRYS